MWTKMILSEAGRIVTSANIGDNDLDEGSERRKGESEGEKCGL